MNCSKVLSLLIERAKITKPENDNNSLDLEEQFYSKKNYWTTLKPLSKFFFMIYLALVMPYSVLLKFIMILGPLSKLNTVMQIRSKNIQLKKCAAYLKQLKKPNEGINQFDHHFYKLAVFIKFCSLITHFICDILFGLAALYVLYNYNN